MRVSKRGGLVFNFSELPAAPSDLYKKAAIPRPKQAEAERSRVVIVEDDGSPLFEPLGGQTSDQTEMVSAPAHAQGARKSTDSEMNRPTQKTGSTQTPARPPVNGSHLKKKAHATQLNDQSVSKRERITYRDSKGIGREIWQPGDPHGVRESEYPQNIFTKRWRFFQSDIGPIVRGVNSPPHYVALDDKAAWDVVSSRKYTNNERGNFWALDFTTGSGRPLSARLNKGRAAVVAEAVGKDRDEGDGQGMRHVGYVLIGEKDKKKPYYFSGEIGGYNEVIFDVPSTGSVPAGQTAERYDGSKTENRTANRNDGRKTRPLGKRKAEESVNPRHTREKVGKYLFSTPSPTWPGGSRRLNKPPVQRPRDVDGAPNDHFYGSEMSPLTTAGGKTVYATNIEEEPERVKGRLVASGRKTPHGAKPWYANGARTPWVDRPMEARTPRQEPVSGTHVQHAEVQPDTQPPYHDPRHAQGGEQPLWQVVKRMEEELEQTRGLLRSRDEEIGNLRAQTNDPKAAIALRAKDVEIQELKADLRQALGDY